MHSDRWAQLDALLPAAAAIVREWEAGFGPYPAHPASALDPGALTDAMGAYADRLADHYPFFHPRYAGQMLKPPHPAAVAGYLAAMLVNPNNHALDGGPGASALEKEVVRDLAAMFRLPADALGHLTSSGTVANLEALWVARELRPGTAVLHGEGAHYTHGRMCRLLGVEARTIPSDSAGRLDLDAAETALRRGGVGTLVLTAGTTGLGAVDPIDDVLELRERYGVRLHVDAAYGGFFALLAWGGGEPVPAALRAVGQCDSVVVDPHKHGLQPYGCGAVLFADPAVGRLYAHDSPYTYFTSDELHLGEISLECSRAGAAAAALWLTLQLLPLEPGEGLGAVLGACLRAARALAGRLAQDDRLTLHLEPELDIVTFFPHPPEPSLAAVEAGSQRLLRAGMDAEDAVFLSALRLPADVLRARHPRLVADADSATVLRSVLMKPEHEDAVPWLHERLRALAAG